MQSKIASESPEEKALLLQSQMVIEAPKATGVEPGSLEWLKKKQAHPDAVENIVSKLKGPGFCKTLLNVVLAVPLLVTLLCIIALLFILIVPPVLPFYFMCPDKTRKAFGIMDKSTRDVADWMLPESPPSSIPAKLRGVIYMRNSNFDDLVSFERAAWDSTAHTSFLPFYWAYAWSVQQGLAQFILMFGSKVIGYRYKFSFNEDLTEADIGLYIFCVRMPAFFVTFRMTDVSALQDGSLWERWTTIFGQPQKSYWAEKVVNGDGTKTPYWSHVLDEVAAECWTKSAV